MENDVFEIDFQERAMKQPINRAIQMQAKLLEVGDEREQDDGTKDEVEDANDDTDDRGNGEEDSAGNYKISRSPSSYRAKAE